MSDAGPLALIDHEGADEDDAGLLPVSVVLDMMCLPCVLGADY